ncbi:MAG: hypothetical protein EOO42_12880 [Flavobacteriales bacterium]|nr:MAG: hypothetical protein EOO42_12880 [Flavobacteriales bacterium]
MRNISWICLISCLVLSNIGCVKDKMTAYKATLHNNSGVRILILPYKGGFVSSNDTIRLENGASMEIANGSEWGEVKIPFFSSQYLAIGQNDSIKIVFDSSFAVAHFWNTPGNLPSKYHLFNSNRNIINRDSYSFSHNKTKKGYLNEHTYTFTEDDYNFARQ